MNEPKVHMLKSGMIADKIIIMLLIAILIISTLYFIFQKNIKEEVILTTTDAPFPTKKIKLLLRIAQHRLH